MVGAASLSSTVLGETAAASEDYDRVVNMVEAGADNSGNEPIDDVFAEEKGDDTLLKFPEGTYKANHLSLWQLNHFAMVGDDATLVPGDNYNRNWIAGAETRDLRIENFTIDNTASGKAPEIHVSAHDGLVIRDITKRGYHDGGGTAFDFWLLDSTGEGLLERITATDGGKCVGIYVHEDNAGTMVVRNCNVEYFEDNGLYASHGSGAVKVDGGTYRNNNVSQIRLGSPNSEVIGADMAVTERVPPDKDTINMRGIRIADGPGPVKIADCDIDMRAGEGSGGIVGAFNGGSFHVRNTRIRVLKDYTTLGSDGARTSWGVYVARSTEGERGKRTFKNVSITGGGAYRSAMTIRRNANEIRDCCINQTGSNRNGITFEDSSNNVVSNTTIDVGDEAIRLRDSSVKRSNISKSGSCPSPGDDSSGMGAVDGGRVETYQPSGEWQHVSFDTEFQNPVAFMGPLSFNGEHPCHTRVRGVDTGFAYQFEEWEETDGKHQTERSAYLALEAGAGTIGERQVEVGRLQTGDQFGHVDFDTQFGSTPVVFSQSQTYNGPNPVVTRHRNPSPSGVDVRLQEEEGPDPHGPHRIETIGYLAVEPGRGTVGDHPYEVGVARGVDGDWSRVKFDRTYDQPLLYANIQTYNGPNPANLRYRNLGAGGVELTIEEGTSGDQETAHVAERVGYLVVDAG